MKITKFLKKSFTVLSIAFAFSTGIAEICAQDEPGLGDAAAALLNDFSSDALMEELLNSPFLSDEDRKQLAEMSPDDQQKLFDDVVGIFNDPEFQAILNDPEFAKQMEEVSQMLEAGDFDVNALDELDDFDEDDFIEPTLPAQPTIPVVEVDTKPSKHACRETADMLQKINYHLSSLISKAPYYETIEQYVGIFIDKIQAFQHYLEMLKKPENLDRLASDEYISLNKSLCKLMNILATFEPEVLLDERPQNHDLYDPYEILGVSRAAQEADITRAFQIISQQKSPESVKERLLTRGLSEKEMNKKIKAAEIAFEPIQKAYDDLMDKEFRQEIDRILEAERRREKGLEQLAQQAIWEINRALDEAFFSPGTVLKETIDLLETYDAQALEMFKKREEEERTATKKVEKYAKKQPRLTPLPPPKPEIQYGTPSYGKPSRPKAPTIFEKPTPAPSSPAAPGTPSPQKPDGKKEEKKDEKKDDGKKDEKKDEKKDGGKKEDKKKDEKKPEEDDDVTKSIKALDGLLTDIEGGKKGKIEAKKREEFVQKLHDLNTDLRSMVNKELDKTLEELSDKLRLETVNEHIKKIGGGLKELEKKQASLSPEKLAYYYKAQSSAFQSLLKNHGAVLSELESLQSLTSDQMQDPQKKTRYFPTTRKLLEEGEEVEKRLPAEAPELNILQKNLGKLFAVLSQIKTELDPATKHKIAAEQAQKAQDERREKLKKKHKV